MSRKNDEELEDSSVFSSETGRILDAPRGLRILPLGGLGEIGMNCMVLEFEDEIIVVDVGLLFSDLEHFGVEFVIPDFSYLVERKDKVKAFVITHGHEDHVGALAFALKAGIQAPVFASPFSSQLIRGRMKEYGLESTIDLRTFKLGDTIQLKHFKVATTSVNHSIVDAGALIIDTPVGRVIHTGDFKIDPTPFYGSKIDDRVFRKAGDEGVLLLLSDSTNVEKHEHGLSEARIYQSFEQLFAAAEGMVVVAMFASNVARMGQVFEIAKKLGKRVAIAGRSMEQNSTYARDLGYLKDAADVLIPIDDIGSFDRNKVIVLSSGSQAEQGSALLRMAIGEHKQIQLQQQDLVVMSSRYIPGNERAIGRMINKLFECGAEVLYEAVHEIHASGHATRPELKQMIEWTKPKYFIPIHGEYRHLVHHAKLAQECGVKNVGVFTNGDVIEIESDRMEKIDHIEEPRVLVEGREGNDISKLVLKDRRQIGEKGIVFSLMVRNVETRRIMAGPEIITRGLANESMEGFLVEEARHVVRRLIVDYEKAIASGDYRDDFQETVRIELRRFFNQNIGKKPVVLPIILDL